MKLVNNAFLIFFIAALTGCNCSKDNSGSADNSSNIPDIPVITTIGGAANSSWVEQKLTASSLPPVQMHLSNDSRAWIYANVLRSAEAWILPQGSGISSDQAEELAGKIEMRSDGWPASLPGGYFMTLNRSGYPTGVETDPEGNEDTNYLHGVWVLTWEGSGDVRFYTSTNDGSGETLLLNDSANGRIVKLITDRHKFPIIEIYYTDPSNPVRNMKLWAPVNDGAGLELTSASVLTPGNVAGSLEPAPGAEEPVFHPEYLVHLAQPGDGIVMRFMGFLKINQSEEVWAHDVKNRRLNWSDRGHESYCFDSLSVCDSSWTRHNVAGYKQKLGTPYEWLIDLCNQTNNDMWIQVPHLASEDLIRNLARLIAGKNGHEGLNSNLRVWFEFSNEIWNGASVYLPQYNFANYVAADHFGVSEAEITTEQRGWAAGYLQAWAISVFEDEWAKCGETDARLVNVVAGFAMSDSYNRAQIRSVKEINPELAETIAISNYFGYTPSREIFQYYDWASSDGVTWPDSLLEKTKKAIRRNIYDTYSSWQANGRMAEEEGVYLISYEGGQHLLVVGLGDSTAPDVSKFMKYMSNIQRHDIMKELYAEHYALWSAAGGRPASLFVDIGPHSYWGYWGAKEFLKENPVKWQAFKEYNASMNGIRALNEPVGNSPVLEDKLFSPEAGISFSGTITATGGDGSLSLSMIGGELPEGITFSSSGGTATLSGTATASGTYRIIVRAVDSDNDPAYGVYTITVYPEGMSSNSIVSFNGSEIPATVQSDGSLNGRYDLQRSYEYLENGSILCMPFSIEDGSVLFADEFDGGGITGKLSIPESSQLNMYGGCCVNQDDSSVPYCESTWTSLRNQTFASWSGANYNGRGAATTLNIFLVWKKEQFTGYINDYNVFSFGSGSSASTMRADFTGLAQDRNEIRFAVLNREATEDTWYISEAAYTENYVGDGYIEINDFNDSSEQGNRWAAMYPAEYSFGIPDESGLTFEAHSFDNIQAVGLLYKGGRDGYHYSVEISRFLVLGNHE